MTEAMMQFILLALQAAPGLIASAQAELAVLHGGASPEQQDAIDVALEAAHAALQAARPADPTL